MNATELLEKAKDGSATKAELAEAAARLRHGEGGAASYTLIHALGRGGAKEYAPLVREYLESPDDPMLARIALLTLCRYWELVEEYESEILRFVAGVDWDDGGHVRLIAISLLGDLLLVKPRAELRRQLLAILLDEHESMPFRSAAYSALASGMGVPTRNIRELWAPEDVGAIADPKILAWARS